MEMLFYAIGETLVRNGVSPIIIALGIFIIGLVVQCWPLLRGSRATPVETGAARDEALPGPTAGDEEYPKGGDGWTRIFHADGSVEDIFGPLPRAQPEGEAAETILRLRLELAEMQSVMEALSGVSVARFQGRAHSWKGKWLHLAIQDPGEGHQRIVVQVPDEEDRETIKVGMEVELIAHYRGGKPVLERLLSAEECEGPIPELPELPTTGRVPEWFDSSAKNPKRALLKASEGSSSVSEVRLHLVWACKRRGSWLTNLMVERLKNLVAEVVEERKLGKLLAVNVGGKDETRQDFIGDHVHVAVWTFNTLSPSEVTGAIKAYVSRKLRQEFPELVAHNKGALFQRGFYASTIGSGGDLSTVLAYIEGQQKAPESEVDETDDNYDQEEGGEDDAA